MVKPNQQSGVTMLEFVIVGPIMLFVVLVTLDLLRISYNTLTLQYVVTRVAREAALGKSVPNGYSKETWIKEATSNYSRRLGVSITAQDVKICPARQLNCSVDNAGRTKELFVLTATVPIAGLVMPNSLFNLSSSVIAKNEPR